MFFKLFIAIYLTILSAASKIIEQVLMAPPSNLPFTNTSNFGLAQSPFGERSEVLLFYQASTGIRVYTFNGAFDVAETLDNENVVPASEVLQGTPLRAAVVGPDFTEVSLAVLVKDDIIIQYGPDTSNRPTSSFSLQPGF
ncbi:hypothetical protein C0991_004403 [Blastosporella zonata]|nr:hypothetical protein C0991_004403 [Blastosporella zonata]